mmetsp:Transcript_1950/g.7152  ORF Transcript_1950/g.7152 Transcript_1950/m.7152 type:complete len:579 (+) Transcript_1950:218-1954(+)
MGAARGRCGEGHGALERRLRDGAPAQTNLVRARGARAARVSVRCRARLRSCGGAVAPEPEDRVLPLGPRRCFSRPDGAGGVRRGRGLGVERVEVGHGSEEGMRVHRLEPCGAQAAVGARLEQRLHERLGRLREPAREIERGGAKVEDGGGERGVALGPHRRPPREAHVQEAPESPAVGGAGHGAPAHNLGREVRKRSLQSVLLAFALAVSATRRHRRLLTRRLGLCRDGYSAFDAPVPVAQRSDNVSCLLNDAVSLRGDWSRRPKVAKLCVSGGCEEHILRFEVAVRESSAVDAVERGDHFARDEARRGFVERPAILEERVEVAFGGKFHDEVGAVAPAERCDEPRDAGVREDAQHRHLAADGRLVPVRLQHRERDHFDGVLVPLRRGSTFDDVAGAADRRKGAAPELLRKHELLERELREERRRERQRTALGGAALALRARPRLRRRELLHHRLRLFRCWRVRARVEEGGIEAAERRQSAVSRGVDGGAPVLLPSPQEHGHQLRERRALGGAHRAADEPLPLEEGERSLGEDGVVGGEAAEQRREEDGERGGVRALGRRLAQRRGEAQEGGFLCVGS